MYLADTVNSRITKFDANGKFLFNMTGDGDRRLFQPATVAVDSTGNVYTISNQAIWKFDPNGQFAGEWFVPYTGNLVIDPRNNMYLIGQFIVKIAVAGGG